MIPEIQRVTWYRKKYLVVDNTEVGSCDACFFHRRAEAHSEDFRCPRKRIDCFDTVEDVNGNERITRDVICIEDTPEAFAEYIAIKLGVSIENQDQS